MTDEANARNSSSANPMELWKQWYDSSGKMWGNLMEGGKESYVDPYGLYRSWLKGVGEATEQVKEAASTPPFPGLDIQELWKQWFDATTQVWHKAVETGADPLGLTGQWLKLMEESRARFMAGEAGGASGASGALPGDPFSFFKQWYEATSESWSRIAGETFSNEKFIEAASQFLESYTGFYRTLRHSSEEYLRNLQFATRSDVARVAGLVVALEEKIDHIEEALGDFADGSFQIATDESVSKLAGELARVKGSIGALPTKADIESLAQRLDKVEDSVREIPTKIDMQPLARRLDNVESNLEQLSAGYAKAEAVQALTKRLDGVENKLDRVLEAVEKLNTRAEAPEGARSAGTRARRTAKAAAGAAAEEGK